MNLQYPFAYKVNPIAEKVAQKVNNWALGIGLLEDKTQVKQISAMKLNWFGSYLYPNSNENWLFPVCKLFCILFLLDDHLEKQGNGQNLNWLNALSKFIINKIENPKLELPNQANQYLRAFCDFIESWNPSLNKSGFTNQLKLFWEGQLWEASNRVRSVIPDLTDYRMYRPYFSGAHLALFLAKDLLQYHADQCQLKYIEDRAAHIICLANDLGSFEKELLSGEVHNEVVILMKNHKLTNEKAVQIAKKRHDRLLQEFLDLVSDNSISPAYTEAIQFVIAGCQGWSTTETTRYTENGIMGL